MTDYEPYVAEPAEPPPPQRLARLRPVAAWWAGIVLLLALSFAWLQSTGTEDPSLNVPADQLTPADPAAPPADPAAPPADPAAPPADPAPAEDPAAQPAP